MENLKEFEGFLNESGAKNTQGNPSRGDKKNWEKYIGKNLLLGNVSKTGTNPDNFVVSNPASENADYFVTVDDGKVNGVYEIETDSLGRNKKTIAIRIVGGAPRVTFDLKKLSRMEEILVEDALKMNKVNLKGFVRKNVTIKNQK